MNCPPCSDNYTVKSSVLLTPVAGVTETSHYMLEEKLFHQVQVELPWQQHKLKIHQYKPE